MYESTGIETHFSNGLDPIIRARSVFAFHKPDTLRKWLVDFPQQQTFLARMQNPPLLNSQNLWLAQSQAITGLEQSLRHNKSRALVQMATGSGKTFTAINLCYRLIKFAKVKRILFLVDVYTIETKITKDGSTIEAVEAGYAMQVQCPQTRAKRWETMDDDFTYQASQLDRDVVTPAQIRTVLETFRNKALPETFPDRSWLPKTLIFAKDDNHAENIVQIAREVFNQGNDFVQKITYKTTGRKPDELIKAFRTGSMPRIAVTVDMIATGTDIKAVEIVFFMRAVQSRCFFEQMKGRGVRVMRTEDLQSVTPDAPCKDHFLIVDAVGV